MGPADRRGHPLATPTRITSPVSPCCSIATRSAGSSSPACAGPGRATRRGSRAWRDRARRSGWGSPPATGSRSTRSASASCGRSAARCPPSRRTAGPASTTSRSCCSARSGRADSCSRATSRRASIRRCLRDGLPQVDLLKVAHHGSRTATTQAFVDAVRPTVAVASAGRGKPVRPSGAATLERLAAAGARVLRTDRDGTVAVAFGGRDDGPGRRRPRGRRRDRASRRVERPPREPTDAPPRSCARSRSPALVPARERRQRRPATAAAGPTAARGTDRPAATVGYHRADDGARARGGRLPPALPGSPALVRAARARRGRGRRLAGGADRGSAGSPWIGALVEAAALLHDVDKALPADDPARALPHGDGSAAWLTRQGHPELARAVASHPVTRLARRRARTGAGRRSRRREERIVAYADKRAGQRLEVDGRAVRLVAPPLSAARSSTAARRLGGRRPARRPGARRPARAGRLPCGRGRARPRSAGSRWTGAALRARGGDASATSGAAMTTVPLAFFWGDDDLSAARAVDRFEAALAAETRRRRWSAGTAAGQPEHGRPSQSPSSTSGSRRRSCSGAGRWRSSRTRRADGQGRGP